ncbi:MAG: hypothetical protein RL380_773 [Verrucomicrobiota bacterium]
MTSSKLDSGLRRYVPLLVWLLCAGVVLFIPLQIIKLAYLPPDDCLRYAARAVTGKPWSEILVLADPAKLDHNFGWSALLRQFHLAANLGPESLVMLSVVGLFAVAGWSGLLWLRRPEAWLVPLILIAAGTGLPARFMLGRPFMLTIAALVTVLMLWQRRGERAPGWREVTLMTGVITAACFLHGCWYLWAVAVLAFGVAQQWRWAVALAASWLGGTVLAGIFTGHPLAFTWQAIEVALQAFGGHETQRTMQSEYQPATGDCFALIVLAGLAILRALTRPKLPPLPRNPAFWLALLGWALGFKASRFWLDWGWPALIVLVACEVQAWWENHIAEKSFARLALTFGLATTLFLAVTADLNNRWTWNRGMQFLSATDPDLAGWLPADGGIIYSAEMAVFYRTFYQNPEAKWRYVLGYEPIFMPRDDFKTYENILANHDHPVTFLPWVKKLQSADRLIGRLASGLPAAYPQLEWNRSVGDGLCIGRLPSPPTGTPAP